MAAASVRDEYCFGLRFQSVLDSLRTTFLILIRTVFATGWYCTSLNAEMVPGAGIEPARELSPEGFSYPLQFSLLCVCTFVVWTFSLPYPDIRNVGRSRQVSTRSCFISPHPDPLPEGGGTLEGYPLTICRR